MSAYAGTYNNQYMVIDLKRVHLGRALDDGALWIVEQIPGYVESADETQILRAGLLATYRVVNAWRFSYHVT